MFPQKSHFRQKCLRLIEVLTRCHENISLFVIILLLIASTSEDSFTTTYNITVRTLLYWHPDHAIVIALQLCIFQCDFNFYINSYKRMFKTIARTVKQIPDTTCGAYCITNECRVFELHLIGTTSMVYKPCIWNRVFYNIIKIFCQ